MTVETSSRRDSADLSPGYVDGIDGERHTVSGWVRVVDGQLFDVDARDHSGSIGVVTLGQSRPDVEKFGIENRGFTITFSRPLRPDALLGGEMRVFGGTRVLKLSKSMRRHEERAVFAWAERLTKKSVTLSNAVSPTGFSRVPGLQGREDVSHIPLPVGTTSRDGSAVVGRGGQLFLIRGSNVLEERYKKPTTASERRQADEEVGHWTSLFRRRSQALEQLGVRYSQTVVPEKSSTMMSGIRGFEGSTPTLEEVERAVASESWYFSAREVLRKVEAEYDRSPWMKLDTHFSPLGAMALARGFISSAVPEFSFPHVAFDGAESIVGDLTERFFGVPVQELVEAPSTRGFERFGRTVELIDHGPPTEGGNVMGMRRVWRNPGAPIDRRVVVFGGSSFSRNQQSAAKCNYWFARLFREHHFIWTPWIDVDYVRSVRPDYVLAQARERFMGIVPEDRGM